ncbi:uncharacterized protein EI90DRAFT_3255305 [Cantharellus anzutake]|uniref:uncharacterized protein n=1 Tax=Cantharellus anzutake TaxID=1750568 RepID=UPI0019083B82|nr:uncharacterized protein EI90DRAFT_3255305 [Cantharellus anzutake]KAF8337401.1 hypothetical protein EI90DRAFT_3255305 [Cantharellus anzutake]
MQSLVNSQQLPPLQEEPSSSRRGTAELTRPENTHTAGPGALEAQHEDPHLQLPGSHWDRPSGGVGNLRAFWSRLKGEHKNRVPGWVESFKNVIFSSALSWLIVFIPLAWISHFSHWSRSATFALSLLAITSLEKILEYAGESFAHYCGHSLGDLITITLDNVVEASLAIILVSRCDLRLAQSTVVGVLLLHLLLVPGVAFITGGAKVLHQHLDPHVTELNSSLLTIGVLTLLIPAAFFSSIIGNHATPTSSESPVSDASRDNFLRLSRGLAVILLVIRIYLHNPPGEGNALRLTDNAPQALKEKVARIEEEDAEMNPWSSLIVFAVVVPLTAVTAEFLVESLEHIRETSGIKQEWFGLILLPVVSYSGSALVTILYFIRKAFLRSVGGPPDELAKARTIDLSIQFALFWMPFLVLLAWWQNKPLFLLFDRFEVALAIGACFLVNTVTDDSKTNWAEGFVMISFYIMIAVASWYYDGEQEIQVMLFCKSVAASLNSETGSGA